MRGKFLQAQQDIGHFDKLLAWCIRRLIDHGTVRAELDGLRRKLIAIERRSLEREEHRTRTNGAGVGGDRRIGEEDVVEPLDRTHMDGLKLENGNGSNEPRDEIFP